MKQTLTVDRGNSMTKIALWQDDKLCRLLTATCADEADCVRHIAGEAGRSAAAIISSVNPHSSPLLEDALRSAAETVVILSAATELPVAIEYASPETLGSDRIAAAVGARAVAGHGVPVLVADLGTAATFDLLTADDRYTGGNISAGVGMRLSALHARSARLPEVSVEGPVPTWGYDTDTALRSGALRGVAAELEYYRLQAPAGSAVVLTGGDAEAVGKLVGFNYILEKNLVLLGLNRILHHHNEA